jgi:hypothetical protein
LKYAGLLPPFFSTADIAPWMTFSSMSQIAATSTSDILSHWLRCSRPRPFTPMTAMRSRSLAPTERRSSEPRTGIDVTAAAAAASAEFPRNCLRENWVIGSSP